MKHPFFTALGSQVPGIDVEAAFASVFGPARRTSPNVIEAQAPVEPCGGTPCIAVGRGLPAVGQRTQQEQHLADLEVLDRCEQQIERDAGCPAFFACMGELHRERGGA